MTKDELITSLKSLEVELKKIQKTIAAQPGPQIRQLSAKDAVLKVARSWFEKVEKQLVFYGVASDKISKYSKMFDNLLQMSFTNASKSRYVSILDEMHQSFNKDIAVPVYKFTGDITDFGHLDAILSNLAEDEKPLMQEAIHCARSGYRRASVVLGWAASINRMHKIVEKLGFDEFNKKSKEMNDIVEGRYKRFKKYFHVVNMAELQATVFDNDLLWVLEYCQFIDNNQHERLSACFVMRNSSAHPGASVMTEDNVVSFYSDLKTIIFDNTKFKLEDKKEGLVSQT